MNLDSRHMVLFFMSSPIWKQEMMGHESEKNSLKNYMPTLLLFCKYLITESIARFTSQVSLTRKPCEYLSLVNSSRPNLREAWRPYSLVPRDLDVDRKLHPMVYKETYCLKVFQDLVGPQEEMIIDIWFAIINYVRGQSDEVCCHSNNVVTNHLLF